MFFIGHTGLHLTLFTEQPEYVGLFAQEAGVRVAIHPPNVFPFPEDDGAVASTGQATDIGMRQVCIEKRKRIGEGRVREVGGGGDGKGDRDKWRGGLKSIVSHFCNHLN